jgi:hypothetical protein
MFNGAFRPVGPNGLPLWLPKGLEADGPREILKSERDHNMITQWALYTMFMNFAGGVGDFSDGTDTYQSSAYGLFSGAYVMPTTVAAPSGEVSAITMASGSGIFTKDSSEYIIPSGLPYSVSSYSVAYAQTSGTLTFTLLAGSSSFNVAQVGLLPALYDGAANTIDISPLVSGVYHNTAETTIPTVNTAVWTTYPLSSTYTVPASGAITVEYGITATL